MARLCCVGCSGGLSITLGGSDHVVIDARGRRWTFEFHPYCGPIVLKANGDPASRQPSSRSPFWPPFEAWLADRKAVKKSPTTPPRETAR